VVAPA